MQIRPEEITSIIKKQIAGFDAKADVEESEAAIAQFKEELEELAEEQRLAVEEIQRKWDEVSADVSEIPVSPYKKDIAVPMFGIAWLPYYLVMEDGRFLELPAFSPSETD